VNDKPARISKEEQRKRYTTTCIECYKPLKFKEMTKVREILPTVGKNGLKDLGDYIEAEEWECESCLATAAQTKEHGMLRYFQGLIETAMVMVESIDAEYKEIKSTRDIAKAYKQRKYMEESIKFMREVLDTYSEDVDKHIQGLAEHYVEKHEGKDAK
jgi:hypothetical protein